MFFLLCFRSNNFSLGEQKRITLKKIVPKSNFWTESLVHKYSHYLNKWTVLMVRLLYEYNSLGRDNDVEIQTASQDIFHGLKIFQDGI